DLLIILTDQQGLFDADPSIKANAQLIKHAEIDDPLLDEVAGDSQSGLGRGGMITKVNAARLASRSGASTVIVSGAIHNIIKNVLMGKNLGTYLISTLAPLAARKQWLAAQLQLKGTLSLDAGAVDVLKKKGKSLLAIGVKSIFGEFHRGDLVTCLDPNGKEIARGLINYDAKETRKIIGKSSQSFEKILGYVDDDELIHRNNMWVI
ncbi:MAG: glutamate 5-kinase, partial [Methylococcales bacterium]|nr:glutamate 5-kinase [Methylococcales bacterium]